MAIDNLTDGEFLEAFIREARVFLENVVMFPITAMTECPYPNPQFDFEFLRTLLHGAPQPWVFINGETPQPWALPQEEAPILSFEENMMRVFSTVEMTEDFKKYAYTYFTYGVAFSAASGVSTYFNELFSGMGEWKGFVLNCNYGRSRQIDPPALTNVFCSCCEVPHHPINDNECFFGTRIYFGPTPKFLFEMWDISRTFYTPMQFIARRFKQTSSGCNEEDVGSFFTQEELDELEDYPDDMKED